MQTDNLELFIDIYADITPIPFDNKYAILCIFNSPEWYLKEIQIADCGYLNTILMSDYPNGCD